MEKRTNMITTNNAVIFDMDGILFDTEKLIIDCWEIMAEKYGISGIREVCYECLGTNREMTKKIFLKHYGENVPYDDYQVELRALFTEYWQKNGMPVKPGVYELMESLKKAGIRIALATSTRKASVMPELENADLTKYFDVIVCGDMVSHSKPHPEIYLLAAEKLGVEPKDAFAIEDSYNGVRSAAAAGLRTIMVPDLVPSIPETDELAEIVLPSLVEVREYLK